MTLRVHHCVVLGPISPTNVITMTSWWAWWRLRSSASSFITQPFIKCGSKKTSKLHAIGLCAGTSPVTSEFPAQMASNAENGSIWWRHHGTFVIQNLQKAHAALFPFLAKRSHSKRCACTASVPWRHFPCLWRYDKLDKGKIRTPSN